MLLQESVYYNVMPACAYLCVFVFLCVHLHVSANAHVGEYTRMQCVN